MTSDVEYLLLKDKGPYHEVYVRNRLNTNPGACKFYTIVITVISICLVLLLFSLVYVFVLVPSWQGSVLSWDGRPVQEARTHVLTRTHCGPVEGAAEEGVYVFKGIPYALPPVGPRRWDKPRALSRQDGTCWRGALPAKRFGSACVQPADRLGNYSSFTGSEDCLFLNVWTQSLDPLAKLPVIFWVHGGSLVLGSGNAGPWSPTPEVTKSTRAVYVSVNYRLGPMGFLTLDALSKASSSGTSGNYGLMDIIQALRWVRDNINNFGGNPNKVTLLGGSSGGTAVHALLASPLASGLFQRAWLASPSAILNKTSGQAGRDNQVVVNRTGCADAACLRALSARQVMLASPWAVFPFWSGKDLFHMPVKGRFQGALAVVDGYVLKEAPLQALKYGRGNDVPTMFTTTAQELDLLPFDPTIVSWSWPHYTATVKKQLTPFSPHIAHTALDLYPSGSSLTPEYQYTSMLTDIRVTCPVNVLADVTAQGFQSSVFRAVVTATPSLPVNLTNTSAARYAFHGWDTLVFFGNFQSFAFQPSQSDLLFQKVLRQQMMAFARDGRPEAPVWDTVRTCTALLSDHVFTVEHYNKFRCEFWLKNGFFSYAFIN